MRIKHLNAKAVDQQAGILQQAETVSAVSYCTLGKILKEAIFEDLLKWQQMQDLD